MELSLTLSTTKRNCACIFIYACSTQTTDKRAIPRSEISAMDTIKSEENWADKN